MKLPHVFDKLLVRPQPVSGESSWGFRLRLAQENGLVQPRWLLDPGEHSPSGRARVCSACLARPEPYWRADWSASGTFWCSEHRNWLVDKCPSCRRSPSWGQVRLLKCSCGHDWRDCGVATVDASVWAVVSTGHVPEQVLRVHGALALYGPSGKLGKKIARAAVADVREQCEAGLQAVKDWPVNFFSVLDRWRVPPAGAGGVQLLREALPGIDDVPSLIDEPAWRERVVIAIDAYCAGTVGGPAPIIGRNALLTSGPATLKEISARLGCKVESVARAIDSASADIGGVRVTARGRRRRVIGDADVMRLGEALKEPIALKTAARQLGLPTSRLMALAHAGMLSLPNGRLLRSELSALIRSLPAIPAESQAVPDSALALKKALRDWVHVDDTSAFFRSMREGRLAIYRAGDANALGSWLVPLKALRSWNALTRPGPQSVFTLSEVGASLGLKDDVVRDLIRTQLLPAQRGSLDRHASWVVRAQDLDAFRGSYVPLARLAAKAGVRLKDGFDWAQSRGLNVVCGPRVDGSRQYFVKV